MKKTIKRRIYDTDTSKQLAFKYIGSFGETQGYEERLYITKRGLYFVFGAGGPDSPYPEPTIREITKEQADSWETEITEITENKKAGKEKQSAKNNSAKIKKARKTPQKKSAKLAEEVKDEEPAEDTAE